MKTSTLKRIAAAGAISGAMSLAALGLGSGVADADDGAVPFVPPGPTSGDWQAYIPILINAIQSGQIPGVPADLGGQIPGVPADLGGQIPGVPVDLGGGQIPDLGQLGGLGNIPWQDLLAQAGG